jgi:hypothetical protein
MHGAVDASIAQGRRDAQALSGSLSAMFLRTLGAA